MAEGELTELVLRGLAHRAVFERGQDYCAGGTVRQLRRAGSKVEAQVWGSGPQPYQVRLSLEPPFGSFCDCPYDGGGICKHVVAVGLAWLRAQKEETVGEKPVALTFTERLGELNAGQLRDLIGEVYDQVHDARSVVDRWLLQEDLWLAASEPGAGDFGDVLARIGARLEDLLDLERLTELWEASLEDWTEEGHEAEAELADFETEMAGLVRDITELPPSAGFVVIPALEMVCTRLATEAAEAADVADYWSTAAEEAASALAERLLAAGPEEAAAARERLWPFYESGARFLEPVLLTSGQDPDGARRLAARLGKMGGGTVTAGVKLLLEAGLAEDAEQFIDTWGIQNEASFLLLARHFRAAGLPDKAIAYYRRGIQDRFPERNALTELAEVCAAAGRLDEALEVRVKLFKSNFSLNCWRDAMTAGEAVGRRAEIKDELLDYLRRLPGYAGALCAVLVEEASGKLEHLAEAARVAAQTRSPDLSLEVGKAALRLGGEAERCLALDLLRDAAEQLALHGKNYAYEKAAKVTGLLREYFPDLWPEWFHGFLGRHRRRINLLRELTAAGLYDK